MGSSQHNSQHQAQAFRRGHDVVTSAEMSQSRRTSDAVFCRANIYLKRQNKSDQ